MAGHGAEEFLLTELDDARVHAVSGIGAPVFDATGEVVLSFNLVAFQQALDASTIVEIGTSLREATGRVTASLLR